MNMLIKFGNQLYLTNQVFKGTVPIAYRSLIRCGLWVLGIRNFGSFTDRGDFHMREKIFVI